MIDSVNRSSRSAQSRTAAASSPGDSDHADPQIAAQQEALAKQHQAFDFAMAERAELMREADVMRDMMLEQLKNDEEALKKYIAMI